jgi:hypothetical protein
VQSAEAARRREGDEVMLVEDASADRAAGAITPPAASQKSPIFHSSDAADALHQ